MIPKIPQVNSDPLADGNKRVDSQETETVANDRPSSDRPPLRPELIEALDASWKRNEAAYRYLGR